MMGDSNVNSDRSAMAGPQGQEHRRHPWHHRFSEEEMRVFKECKRESIMYRALPLAAAFGALTFAAVKYGYLKPNARLGAIPKVTLAVILGYGIGKVSYRRTCMKKMMDLPNSHFGQYLRDREHFGRCGPWGFPSRDAVMMFEAGGHPRDFYWGQGPLPGDKPSAPEKNGEPTFNVARDRGIDDLFKPLFV